MNSETATISGAARPFSFAAIPEALSDLLVFGGAGLKPLQALGGLLEFGIDLQRLAEIGNRAGRVAKPLANEPAWRKALGHRACSAMARSASASASAFWPPR